MKRELIVNATPDGVEIALLENKNLVELHQEQYNNNFSVGDIFVGKIRKTVPSLKAAFVDIGFNKDAFLHYTDLGPQILSFSKYVSEILEGKRQSHLLNNFELEPLIEKTGNISDVLNKRHVVLTQILKEPISSKGHRLTCEITLPGRFVVLNPFTNTVSLSRKIKNQDERERLLRLIESIKPQNFGMIVRTAAENKSLAEIHEDINFLLEKWESITNEIKNVIPPARVLSEDSKTTSILRDLLDDSFNQIVVNDKDLAAETKNYIKEIAPHRSNIVQLHQSNVNIFDAHKVSKQIKILFGKTINMASGAYLLIEQTEAMYVIDVNSGHRFSTSIPQETNAITINLEAAQMIAQQLRLRDLGGLIIIDFIDMKKSEHREMLWRRMKEEMAYDRATHTILPLSKFGLMQITRERVRQAVEISTAEVCPTCKGGGKVKATILVIDEIENNLSYMLHELDYQNLKLEVHPFVDAYLKKGIISRQWKWFWKHKKWVTIVINSNFSLMQYRFFDAQSDEIKL